MASALWPKFDKAIADETSALIAAQVSPWAHLHAGRAMVVHRLDGTAISLQGAKFVGAPEQLFWRNYIEPFLEKMAVEQLRAAAASAREAGLDATEVIAEVDALLVAACRKVYLRMADVDARLRTEGYPDGQTRRSIKRELHAMEEFIRKYATSLIAMAAIASPKTPTFVEYVRSHLGLMVLLVLLLVTLGVFFSR